MPEQFGLIGMISVVLAIGNALLDGGTTNSLIRDPDCDHVDYSTVFIFQLGASLFVYFVIFLLAPVVAQFYEQPSLINILRVYGLTIIIGALSIVQFAILTKQMTTNIGANE